LNSKKKSFFVEYRINYIRKIVEPTKGQPVPQMLHVGDGKFEGTSTNHSDYKNFGQQARVKYIIPGKNVNSIDVRNNTKFEGVSSHKQDFKKFEKYSRPMQHVQPEYINHEDDR
jgi:hypothetical protein